MPDRWNRAPDQIEPITAYRAWYFNIAMGRADLYPIAQHGAGWEGAVHGWVTAACVVSSPDPWHRAPIEECSCGFYAMSTLDPVVDGIAITAQHWVTRPARLYSGVVLGRVQLAGKVIEHEHGYRAERARIAQFIPIHGWERHVMVLGDRLGVPLTNAVGIPTIEEVDFGLTQAPRSPRVAAYAPLHPAGSHVPLPLHHVAADRPPEEGEWNVILFGAICVVGLLVLTVGNNASPSFADDGVVVVSRLTIILAIIGSRSALAGRLLRRTAKRFAAAVSMLACRTRSIWPRRATRS